MIISIIATLDNKTLKDNHYTCAAIYTYMNVCTYSIMCVCTICSHREVSGCESGPEARVCQPRWIEGPAARAESTPSLADSEEENTTTKTLSDPIMEAIIAQ